MNIDNLTIGQLKEINRMIDGKTNTGPWKVGGKYLIWTVTMALTGQLVEIHDNELVLNDAAWIADTGRFHDNLKSCKFEEVEPFVNPAIIGRRSIIHATEIDSLPKEQK